MLSYYVHKFVPAISVAPIPTSHYTSLYIPMAFQSAGVLNALIACAALHIARNAQPDQVQHYQDASTRYQLKCHDFLKERIALSSQPFRDPYEVVAVTLLLVGLESLISTGSTKWLRQLDCVRRMLSQLEESRPTGYNAWELTCLQRHFTYHDIMASIMSDVNARCHDPTIGSPIRAVVNASERCLDVSISDRPATPAMAAGEQTMSTMYSACETIDPLMGLSQGLFDLMRRIRHLPSTAEVNVGETLAFQNLERELVGWKHADVLGKTTLDLASTLDLIALAEAYRLAALILLYRHADRRHVVLPSLGPRIRNVVKRIPQGSAAEAGLTMPLFLAGSELRDADDMEFCLARLVALHQKYRFGNIDKAENILEEVWRPRLNGQPDRDWEDVLRERQWSISLS